jgi:peptidyl-prolyl cis-trans isomerase SurA
MQRFSQFVLAGFCSALVLAGCAGSGPEVLATIGNESLTLPEFEDTYAKNNGGWDKALTSTMDEREKFLDLLVKFRLKVKEAKERGLMADSSIHHELEGYQITVATSYLLEKEIVEPEIKELYNRNREEVRPSHILIQLGPDASPSDTLAAYNKAMKIIDEIPTNVFDTLAARYSQDPSVTVNKGNLGFVSAGRMVPEFEDACYSLKVGEYTHVPVRTQFGYHIMKMNARQPNKGVVHIAHILRRFSSPTMQDSVAVTDSTWIIYRLLKGGMDFAQAAKQYSQDAGSLMNGGDIGLFERGHVPPNIESIFYSTPVDSITVPLRMPYGYHIFKIVGFKTVPPFSEMEKELRDQYQQTRYNKDYDNYVRTLKKRYRLFYDDVAVEELTHAFDTTLTPSTITWSDTLTDAQKKRVLFLCEDRPATVNDFIEHVNNTSEFKSVYLYPKNVRHMIERMTDAKIVEENARLVPKRYPAFEKLLKEYQDGILLYRIEQDEVWKKVVVNDSLLKIFYDGNKEKFRWSPRVSFAEVYATTDSIANAAYAEIQAGKAFEDVAERYTMRPGYKEKRGVWSLTPNGENAVTGLAATMDVDSVSAPFKHSTGWSIVKVLAKDTSHVKAFEEAMPELMSAYQEYASKVRMDAWIEDLKVRYPVVLKKDLLMEAFKRKPVAGQ